MNTYITPNLAKACRILHLLSQGNRGLPAKLFRERLSISKTTTFRILKTLCAEGFAEKKGHLFYPGHELIQVGLNTLNRIDIREQSVPVLKELTAATRQTSHLAIPSNDKSLILEVCDSPLPVRVASRSGTLVDLYCSSTGKVFLSYLYEDHLEEIYSGNVEAHTKNTICDINEMRREIEQIKAQGCAVDNEEYHEGVRCLAAPVFGIDNVVIGAIGITGPSSSFTPEKTEEFKKKVIESADRLSRIMGH